MTLYRYKALSQEGKKIEAVIEATSEHEAKERLKRARVLVTKFKEIEETKKGMKLSSSFILDLTRELSQLLKAGLPLYESLFTLEEKHRKNRHHLIFLDFCEFLKKGEPLSQALRKYEESFGEVYISMVKAGEETGSLSFIFEQLLILLSRERKLKKQLLTAAAYPAFLGGFCLIVILSFLFFVIPSMQELFEGRELHPLTEVVIGLSRFINRYFLILTLGLFITGAGLYLLFKQSTTKAKIEQLLLHIPLFQKIFLHAALLRFSRTCSLLVKGGIPFLESLHLSRKMMHNSYLESVIEEVETRVSQGKSFSQELRSYPLIPSLFIRMTAIAEETGNLGALLGNTADIYEEDLDKHLQQLLTLIQPLLLLILGAVVGVVILSILLPLTDVGSMVS